MMCNPIGVLLVRAQLIAVPESGTVPFTASCRLRPTGHWMHNCTRRPRQSHWKKPLLRNLQMLQHRRQRSPLFRSRLRSATWPFATRGRWLNVPSQRSIVLTNIHVGTWRNIQKDVHLSRLQARTFIKTIIRCFLVSHRASCPQNLTNLPKHTVFFPMERIFQSLLKVSNALRKAEFPKCKSISASARDIISSYVSLRSVYLRHPCW